MTATRDRVSSQPPLCHVEAHKVKLAQKLLSNVHAGSQQHSRGGVRPPPDTVITARTKPGLALILILDVNLVLTLTHLLALTLTLRAAEKCTEWQALRAEYSLRGGCSTTCGQC